MKHKWLAGVILMFGFLTACSTSSGPKMSQMTEHQAQLSEISVAFSLPPIGDGSTLEQSLNLADDSVYHQTRGALVFHTVWHYSRLIGDNASTFVSLAVKKMDSTSENRNESLSVHVDEVMTEFYEGSQAKVFNLSPEPVEQVKSHGRTWTKFILNDGQSAINFATPVSDDKYALFVIKPTDFMSDKKAMQKSIDQAMTVFESIQLELE